MFRGDAFRKAPEAKTAVKRSYFYFTGETIGLMLKKNAVLLLYFLGKSILSCVIYLGFLVKILYFENAIFFILF